MSGEWAFSSPEHIDKQAMIAEMLLIYLELVPRHLFSIQNNEAEIGRVHSGECVNQSCIERGSGMPYSGSFVPEPLFQLLHTAGASIDWIKSGPIEESSKDIQQGPMGRMRQKQSYPVFSVDVEVIGVLPDGMKDIAMILNNPLYGTSCFRCIEYCGSLLR